MKQYNSIILCCVLSLLASGFCAAAPTNNPTAGNISVAINANSALVGYGTNIFWTNINLIRNAGVVAPTNAAVDGYVPVATGDRVKWQSLSSYAQTNVSVAGVTNAGTMAYSNAGPFLTLMTNIAATVGGGGTDTNAIQNMNGIGTNATIYGLTVSNIYSPSLVVWSNLGMLMGQNNSAVSSSRIWNFGDDNVAFSTTDTFISGNGNAVSNQTFTAVFGDQNELRAGDGFAPAYNFVFGTDNILTRSTALNIYEWRMVFGSGNTFDSGYYPALAIGSDNWLRQVNYSLVVGFGNTVSNMQFGSVMGANNVVDDGEMTYFQHVIGLRNTNISGGYSNSVFYDLPSFTFGRDNTTSNGVDGSVNMGVSNYNSGSGAFTLGRNVTATHSGAFVLGDSQNTRMSSTANNQILLRFQNGLGVNTNTATGWGINVGGAINASAGLYDNGVRVTNAASIIAIRNLYKEANATSYSGSLDPDGYNFFSQNAQESSLVAPGDMLKVRASGVIGAAGDGATIEFRILSGTPTWSSGNRIMLAGCQWTLDVELFYADPLTPHVSVERSLEMRVEFLMRQDGTNFYSTNHTQRVSRPIPAITGQSPMTLYISGKALNTGTTFSGNTWRVDQYP